MEREKKGTRTMMGVKVEFFRGGGGGGVEVIGWDSNIGRRMTMLVVGWLSFQHHHSHRYSISILSATPFIPRSEKQCYSN